MAECMGAKHTFNTCGAEHSGFMLPLHIPLVFVLQAGREAAAVAKAQREEQLATKRARLKAQYIEQQMKAKMAARKTGNKGAEANSSGKQ
jgi:hypothetical protein